MCKTSNVCTILYFSFLGLNLGQELLEGLKYCTWFIDVDSMTKEAVNHIQKPANGKNKFYPSYILRSMPLGISISAEKLVYRETSSNLIINILIYFFKTDISSSWVLKNPSANAGDRSLISGSGRSPGEGNGNPLQYSCLEIPMDRGAWRAIIHAIAMSQIRLSD